MKKAFTIFLIGVIFIVCLIVRFQFDSPVTYQEATESYNSYSLLLTGKGVNRERWPMIFKGEENFPSTLAIYTRLPFIKILGLNNFSVRLPAILSGSLSLILFLFWIYQQRNFIPILQRSEGKILITLSGLLFTFSPWLIVQHIFNLADSLALLLILAGNILHSFRNNKTFWTLGVVLLLLSPLASVKSLPFSLFILSYQGYKLYGRKGLGLGLLSIGTLLILIKLNSGFGTYFIRNSIISDIIPSNYSWKIERRLSYDQVEQSTILVGGKNLNRLIHNKYLYGLNNVFLGLISPFNFEYLSSPFQTQPLLEKESISPKALPKIFFLELPLMLLGIIIVFKKAPKLLFLGAAGLSSAVFSGSPDGLFYLLLFLLIAEAIALITIYHLKKFGFTLSLLILLLFCTSQISFFDLLKNHQTEWVAENDLRQWQIWNRLKNPLNNYSKITVTNRLGEPVNYFLFYNKYPPGDYQAVRTLGGINEDLIRQVRSIKNIDFISFKYLESDRKPNQLWVGLAGEFVGKFNSYKDVNEVSDGKVIYKINGVKQSDQYLGDELWFVETRFEK